MTNTSKTVAERLREVYERAKWNDCWCFPETVGKTCEDFSECQCCVGYTLNTLADMIEAEQAELRAENERLRRDFYEPCARMGFTEHARGIEVMCDAMSRVAQGHECRVDFRALDLLCEKLDCGDAKRRSIAEQIRKAMSGAERPHEVNAGVDVDALLELADHFERLGNQLVPRVEHSDLHRWKARIRDAVKNAKPQLPDTQEAIDADAAKRPCQYFGTQKCRECPQGHADGSDVDYDECCIAQIRDLLKRQRKLMGGE